MVDCPVTLPGRYIRVRPIYTIWLVLRYAFTFPVLPGTLPVWTLPVTLPVTHTVVVYVVAGRCVYAAPVSYLRGYHILTLPPLLLHFDLPLRTFVTFTLQHLPVPDTPIVVPTHTDRPICCRTLLRLCRHTRQRGACGSAVADSTDYSLQTLTTQRVCGRRDAARRAAGNALRSGLLLQLALRARCLVDCARHLPRCSCLQPTDGYRLDQLRLDRPIAAVIAAAYRPRDLPVRLLFWIHG